MWTCPNCSTVNEGATCTCCGLRRPAHSTAYASPGAYRRMLTRQEIKERAKKRLSAQRSNAVLNWFLPGIIIIGAYFLISLISGGASSLASLPAMLASGDTEEAAYMAAETVAAMLGASALTGLLSSLISLVLIPLLTCGRSYNAIRLYRGETAESKNLFLGFTNNFTHAWGGMLWQSLFLFLWSLIPFAGPFLVIIKRYAYSMTPYLLLERPDISARDALKKSIQMTEGHKGKLFVLELSFIGWELLNLLTFGILGIFFVEPYAGIAHAGFYDEMETAYFGGPSHVHKHETVIPADRTPETLPDDDTDGADPFDDRGFEPVISADHTTEPEPGAWHCRVCGKVNYNEYCSNCGNPRSGDVPPDSAAAAPVGSTGRLKITMREERVPPADASSPFLRPPEDL